MENPEKFTVKEDAKMFFIYSRPVGHSRFTLTNLNAGTIGVQKVFAPRYTEEQLEQVKAVLREYAVTYPGAVFQIRRTDGRSVVYSTAPVERSSHKKIIYRILWRRDGGEYRDEVQGYAVDGFPTFAVRKNGSHWLVDYLPSGMKFQTKFKTREKAVDAIKSRIAEWVSTQKPEFLGLCEKRFNDAKEGRKLHETFQN